MRPTTPRPQKSAALHVRPVVSRPSPGVAGRPGGASPTGPLGGSVKILVAGLEKDARGPIEAAVRRALGSRTETEAWTVSLVKVAGKWSVTLNGPEERFRNLSLVADEARLSEVIGEAIGTTGHAWSAAPSAAGPAAGPSGASRDRHACLHCGRPFAVAYESQPNDSQVLVAVACPHCWKTNHVEVGSWAAAGRDYRAEKA